MRWDLFKYISFICFLSALSMLGYFTSDMYLPAFPVIAKSLQTSKAQVELSLSVYMFGLAVGQLFYGPISDKIGRKLTLILGLIIFTLATVGCYRSTSISLFLFFRVIQALGACSTTVIWQAIVVDKFNEAKTHQIFSIVFPLLGVSPAVAPVIGGLLTSAFGWRSIFSTLTILGIVLLLITLFLFKESLSRELSIQRKQSFLTILSNYGTLLRSPFYMSYVGIVCLATSAYFCYLTESPFVLKNLGFTPHAIGFFYIPQTIAFMLGGFTSKPLVSKYGSHKTLVTSIYLSLIGALIMLIASFKVVSSLQIVIPFCIIAFSNGVIYPTAIAKALSRFSHIAGTAAGLSGFLQAMSAFVATSVVAMLSAYEALGMSMVIMVLSLGTLLCYQFVKWVDVATNNGSIYKTEK